MHNRLLLNYLRYLSLLIAIAALGIFGGCTSIGYYAQAAKGQLLVMHHSKPIDRWLSDTQIDENLKMKLQQAKGIREFAIRELGLPDNASYRSYADIKRQYVVWNVVATPELSLVPERWCFLVAGCVDYRGYYDKQSAQDFADNLRKKGMDVRITGVPAYSTLGWFNDPVLSTFIHYPEHELARLIFHELAHQIAYAEGDSTFNESFATAVEEVGVSLWLTARGDPAINESYRQYELRKKEFLALLNTYRLRLESTYQQNISDDEKRQRKSEIIRSMDSDYAALKKTWDGYAGYDRWFNEPVSNAHFSLITTYHELVPEFRALMAGEKTLPNFYRRVKALAKMDSLTRRKMLGRDTSVVHRAPTKIEADRPAALQ